MSRNRASWDKVGVTKLFDCHNIKTVPKARILVNTNLQLVTYMLGFLVSANFENAVDEPQAKAAPRA